MSRFDLGTGYDNMPAGAQLRNNIFYSINELYDDDKGPPDESGTITDDPNLVNPSMSNREAAGAQLQSPSPAIDTGHDYDSHTPAVDFNGNSRTGVIDIGAFEYGGTTDPETPAAPRGLRLVSQRR